MVVLLLPGEFGERARDQARAPGYRRALVKGSTAGLEVEPLSSPVKASTMGRDLEQDRAAFLGAATAGRYAATLLPS